MDLPRWILEQSKAKEKAKKVRAKAKRTKAKEKGKPRSNTGTKVGRRKHKRGTKSTPAARVTKANTKVRYSRMAVAKVEKETKATKAKEKGTTHTQENSAMFARSMDTSPRTVIGRCLRCAKNRNPTPGQRQRPGQ